MLVAESAFDGPAPFHGLESAVITGPVDTARLRAVLARIVERHAALRTVFTRDTGAGSVGGRVLATWQPLVIEQDLPPQPPGTDLVELVHRLPTSVAQRLLLPFDQPPAIFVFTQVDRDRRSIEEIVADMATLRIGASYVGIDTDGPSAVTAAVLDHAGVRAGRTRH